MENTEIPKLKVISITRFFRDPSVWEMLKNEIIPEIVANKKDGAVLRAWVAGCCTGQEAYTMAIIFKEAIEQIRPRVKISLKIYATDINSESIEIAKKGIYGGHIAVSSVSPERMKRYFKKVWFRDQYQVKPEIMKTVVFQHQNLIDNLNSESNNQPPKDMDIISCRYVLMYLERTIREELFDLFHQIIVPGGVFIGGPEITTKPRLFTHIDSLIFKKTQ